MKGDKMEILIIASPKEYVDKFLEVLDKAGLVPVALEVESQSLMRSVIALDNKETTLVIDLDAFRSNLVMIEQGTLQFTSSIPVAGNTFTETLATALGIPSSKAETIKKKFGIENTTEYPNLKTTLLPVLNNLSAEIKNILTFHEEHSSSKVTSIVLCGGSAKLAHLDEFLALQFADTPGLKVSLAKPWANIKDFESKPMSDLDSLGFTTAIGLTMRQYHQ
jgi:type IV pilus assembly protein PilM